MAMNGMSKNPVGSFAFPFVSAKHPRVYPLIPVARIIYALISVVIYDWSTSIHIHYIPISVNDPIMIPSISPWIITYHIHSPLIIHG
jgi:hypothetical protein